MHTVSIITVKSDRMLSNVEQWQIQNIFASSQCPNETLIASFAGCKGLNDGVVTIGEGTEYTYRIEVET